MHVLRKFAAVAFGVGWLALAYFFFPLGFIDNPAKPVTGGEVLSLIVAVLALVAGALIAIRAWRG